MVRYDNLEHKYANTAKKMTEKLSTCLELYIGYNEVTFVIEKLDALILKCV